MFLFEKFGSEITPDKHNMELSSTYLFIEQICFYERLKTIKNILI